MTEASARTPAAVAWPEKMITQAEAFGLAAAWPVKAISGWAPDTPRLDDPDVWLACQRCDRLIGQLRRSGVIYNGSLDEMLSMVLRHMVMVHDVALAGLRKTPSPDRETHPADQPLRDRIHDG
jgi:hypothetical protein